MNMQVKLCYLRKAVSLSDARNMSLSYLSLCSANVHRDRYAGVCEVTAQRIVEIRNFVNKLIIADSVILTKCSGLMRSCATELCIIWLLLLDR